MNHHRRYEVLFVDNEVDAVVDWCDDCDEAWPCERLRRLNANGLLKRLAQPELGRVSLRATVK